MRLAVALALALASVGCTSSSPIGLHRDAAPPEPYAKEYREVVAPHTERTKVFPVEAGALRVNVTMTLSQRGNDLPLPPAAPATVTFSVLDAHGQVVDTATVDARSPAATLLVPTPAAGEWSIHLSGTGTSGLYEDESFGAEYVLAVLVDY